MVGEVVGCFHRFEWAFDSTNVRLYAEESGSADQVAAFIQAYLQKFDVKGVRWFSWAYSSSKMEVDGFGGGAVVITSTDVKFFDAQTWARQEVAKLT